MALPSEVDEMWRGVWTGILSVVLIAGLASQGVTSYLNDTEQNSGNVFSTIANWPEILRPNGVGNSTENSPYGASDNWQCVDEDPADEDSTYIQCDSTSYRLPQTERINCWWVSTFPLC